MKRTLLSVSFFALLMGAGPCTSSDSDDPQEGEGSAGSGGANASGSGGTSGANGQAGTGGTSGTDGAAADGSVGGSAGTSASGSGGSAGESASGNGGAEAGASGGAGTGSAGTGGEPVDECDLDCEADQHCELMEVTCIRAPCNPVPTCVDGAGSAACGSRGLGTCAEDSFCDFPAGADCGRSDAPGTCAVKPGGCTLEYNPVCGCDGETYGNDCAAHSAGVSVESLGECGAETSELHDCNLDSIACDSLTPGCDDGEAPTQSGSCYGPCVPIEQCACGGPSDCPDEARYTCHMSAGHCGPYV